MGAGGSKRGSDERTLTDEITGSRRTRHDEATEPGFEAGEDEADAELAAEGDDMTGERDYPIPAGWDFDDLTNEQFWIKVYDIEHAQEENPKAFRALLHENGFLSEGHFTWVRERFVERHGGDTNFPQSMVNARKAHTAAQLRQAVGAELLEPIEGVTLELYATIQARRVVVEVQGAGAFEALLGLYDMDPKKWNRVDGLWKARMSDPANAVASDSVSAEYRRLFAAASSGRPSSPSRKRG